MPMRHEEIRDRFHLELGRLVQAYAMFDFNVGLALNWLGPHNGEDVGEMLIGKVPLAQRLVKLKPLVLKTFQAAGADAMKEFDAWFEKACELKAIRNDYVHARWGLPSQSESDDPVLTMLPMNWNFDPDQPDASVSVSLSDLSNQVLAVERLSGEFRKLQNDYLAYAAPAITAR